MEQKHRPNIRLKGKEEAEARDNQKRGKKSSNKKRRNAGKGGAKLKKFPEGGERNQSECRPPDYVRKINGV